MSAAFVPPEAPPGAMAELELLTTVGHGAAAAARARLPDLALAAHNAASGHRFSSVAEYLAELSRRTVCVTLLAGSGSRWVRSLEAARARGDARAVAFDASRPRGLFPVRDFLGRRGAGQVAPGGQSSLAGAADTGAGRVAIAAYALAAFRGLGRHLVVVRGWEEAIDAEAIGPAGIAAADRAFFLQAAPFGKPLGHGDAAWQCRAFWEDADYVLTNFGGDASSRRTALISLLALDALNASAPGAREARGKVDLLVPAAPIAGPAYPIVLDEAGLPRSFGHAKLQGREAGSGSGLTNVGVRAYRAPALLEKVLSFRGRFWDARSGYSIPGNDPEGHEFALDNVDADLALEGRARILAAALPEELTPAKSFEDLPAFERAIERVAAEDRG
jgi:hypothetical protein